MESVILDYPQANRRRQVKVSNPSKHGEGSQAYVSYLISSEIEVRRRYHDFVLLHTWLCQVYPQIIIPPLPHKHRMEYVVGDRFSREFLDRRCRGLQLFLDRIVRHPILSQSECLEKFLTVAQMAFVSTDTKKETVFDNLGEIVLNAFVKLKDRDPRLLAIKESNEELERNLVGIEKLHHKLQRLQHELAKNISLLGGAIESLGNLEPDVESALVSVGKGIQAQGKSMEKYVEEKDHQYFYNIGEYISYCHAGNETLKLCEQKMMDHQELQKYLIDLESERSRTLSTGRGSGIGAFFQDKINDFKGIDPERTRRERLTKLETKLENVILVLKQINQAVQDSEETQKSFSESVITEFDLFENNRKSDFLLYFRNLCDIQVESLQQAMVINEGKLVLGGTNCRCR